MSGRRFALISTGAALLVLLLLGGAYLLFDRSSEPYILLPEPLPSGLWPGFSVNATPQGAPYEKLTLTTARAREILESLRRPAAYSQSVQTTLYWEDGKQVQNHQWSVWDGVSLVETGEQLCLFTPYAIYRWTAGNLRYYESPALDARPEEIVGMPSLDSLLVLSDEQWLSAEYRGLSRIRIFTSELYYNGEYTVSLEDGLLLAARYTDGNDGLVFQSFSLQHRLESPDERLFRLPNGEIPPGISGF